MFKCGSVGGSAVIQHMGLLSPATVEAQIEEPVRPKLLWRVNRAGVYTATAHGTLL